MHRYAPANLRSAWWALRAARRTRRVLGSAGLDAALGPPPPPELPDEAVRGARAALRRTGQTCLVRSIVLQAWEAAHGRRRDLIVGVTSADDFHAHAWLEGELPEGPPVSIAGGSLASALPAASARPPIAPTDGDERRYHELLRRPAPRGGTAGAALRRASAEG